jgi:hypothetical protein
MRDLNGYSHHAFDASDTHEDVPSWNFIPPDASTSSALSEDPELERYLVEEIARAKRRSPLMGRLAQVERTYGEQTGLLGAAAPPEPPPLPYSALDAITPAGGDFAMSADGTQIEHLMDDFSEGTPPPALANWLGNARRKRRRSRVRMLLSWIATLAIGAAIVAIALPLQG